MMKRSNSTKKVDLQRRRKKKSFIKKEAKSPPIHSPALVLFGAIQRILPKFGVPLDAPDTITQGLVVRSKKSDIHHYIFVMESVNGILTYSLQFVKSYRPEPDYAIENAVAFAIEGRFCFSITLDAGQCEMADAETIAGDIVQKLTACVMAHLRALPFVEELRGTIAEWASKTKRRSPLTA